MQFLVVSIFLLLFSIIFSYFLLYSTLYGQEYYSYKKQLLWKVLKEKVDNSFEYHLIVIYPRLIYFETWLTNKVSNEKIKLINYVMHKASRGEGMPRYVCSELVSESIEPDVEPVNFESIFVKVAIAIGSIYRSHSASIDSFICMISTTAPITHCNEMILFDDLNMNWLDKSLWSKINIFGNLSLRQLIKNHF